MQSIDSSDSKTFMTPQHNGSVSANDGRLPSLPPLTPDSAGDMTGSTPQSTAYPSTASDDIVQYTNENSKVLEDGSILTRKETVYVDDSKLLQTTWCYDTPTYEKMVQDNSLKYTSRCNLWIDIGIGAIIFIFLILPGLIMCTAWGLRLSDSY